MVEFVLCVPLLAMLIAGMFFFGWALRNQQKTKLAARYTAWRDVHNAGARADASSQAYLLYGDPDEEDQREDFLEDYAGDNVTTPTAELLVRYFLGRKSQNVGLDISPSLTDAQGLLAQEPGSEDANALAEQTAAGEFPSQLAGDVSAEFQADMKIWQRFASSGGLRAKHFRDDVTWRRWQVTTRDAIQDLFLADLDQAVQTLPEEELRKSIENLYLRDW